MANGYDGFNVAMGLFADTFDEDEAKRKEGREERTAIRKEDRADTRLKDQESRLEQRVIRLEDRISDRAIAKRDEERNFTAKNDENIKLIQLKDASAALGLPFEGKSRHELIRQNAIAMSNLGAWGWFMTNKQYIDELPPQHSEAAYQEVLGISGPLDLESLKEQPNEKLLELKARIQTPVESIAKTRAEDRIRKTPGYQKELARVNKISGIIGRGAYDSMTPTISAMEAGDEEATAAHLEVMGLLVNDQEYRDIVNESAGLPDLDDKGEIRSQLLLQNPTAFFGKAYDSRGTGKGMGYLSAEDGLRLPAIYAFAKERVRGDLTGQAAESPKSMTKDNTAALAWLNKELQFVEGNKDSKRRSETFIALLPNMLKELSEAMDSKNAWGPLLRKDVHSWVNELSQGNQRQVEQGGGQPRLGQPERPELPGLGQGRATPGVPTPGVPTTFPGDPRSSVAPLPAPLAPETTGVGGGVFVRGGVPAEAKLNAARKYVEGNESWLGGIVRPSRFPDAGSISPDQMVKEGEKIALRRKAELESMLEGIGAYRQGDRVGIEPSKTVQGTPNVGFGTGIFGDPYGFSGARETKDYAKSEERIARDGKQAHQWFTELDQINADLQLFKQQAERQTGIRIPGLGSGQRQ